MAILFLRCTILHVAKVTEEFLQVLVDRVRKILAISLEIDPKLENHHFFEFPHQNRSNALNVHEHFLEEVGLEHNCLYFFEN